MRNSTSGQRISIPTVDDAAECFQLQVNRVEEETIDGSGMYRGNDTVPVLEEVDNVWRHAPSKPIKPIGDPVDNGSFNANA